MSIISIMVQAQHLPTALNGHYAQVRLACANPARRGFARLSASAATACCPGYYGQVQDQSLWPNWFEGSILAKADILKICPYQIKYPGNLPPHSKAEFRGWNGAPLKDNKKTFFSVIAEFNKGKAHEQQIKPWEQQLLFAMAMQETEAMSGWDTSKTKWAENFSCLNMNYDALDNAGCFEQDREGTLKLLRTGNERDKFAKVLPYMMKWLWGQVPIQADLLLGKVPNCEHAKGRTLASALNFHRGGSTGFRDANAYLLKDSKDHWPDKYGCNHYRNAIVTAAYAISVAKDIYTNDERIGVDVPPV